MINWEIYWKSMPASTKRCGAEQGHVRRDARISTVVLPGGCVLHQFERRYLSEALSRNSDHACDPRSSDAAPEFEKDET
jgi:hypothetical protein